MVNILGYKGDAEVVLVFSLYKIFEEFLQFLITKIIIIFYLKYNFYQII